MRSSHGQDEGRPYAPGTQARSGGGLGVVVAVTVQTLDGGDTVSLPVTLEAANEPLAAVEKVPREVVADKGYLSNATLTHLLDRGLRSYVSESKRGRRIRGRRGKRLLRQRGEKLERTLAHLWMSGGLRRIYVRGQEEIRKRMRVHAAAFNLGLLMRHCFGVGTPRGLQGHRSLPWARMAESVRLFSAISGPMARFFRLLGRSTGFPRRKNRFGSQCIPVSALVALFCPAP